MLQVRKLWLSVAIAAALAVAEEPRQVVEILTYVLTGKLPG